ncbi:hypothetical protein O4214_25165 [Rhodococcus erythropolis]|uniref:hypothetical protein n=1 Tax=Rhodococcus erythropolis TaxID=1833 RepID=UPI001E4106CF|nr:MULTISPECIES: hypothetical protein [Rhodococcus erythropolis group]MCD2108136.1 hypothetical protein [Rhodococcus qingshengii]MCZ4527283.1 hypothetical protein [Rhodococcus erythropolis]
MKIDRILDGAHDPRTSALTRARLSDVQDFDDILTLVSAERAANLDVQIFITLDDLAQASYTSMHAGEADELEVATDDLDFLNDPDAQRRFELRQVAHVAAQLGKSELIPSWDQLHGTRECPPDWIDQMAAVNDEPSRILDDEIHVLHVPVRDSLTAIAGFPNGYFSVDWDTFQNYAVTSHLADAYGYRPLGIGASWIGFERDTPLSSLTANKVIEELKPIYSSGDAPGWALLEDTLTRRRTLFLGYTENFAD